MTFFSRSGFWRTSANGNLHWVTGHMVDRESWERSGGSKPDFNYLVGVLADVRAGVSVASTFVTPNAECPVCGASVFFYQNVKGSRLYFDELGPPWPKHPCTLPAAPDDENALPMTAIEPNVREDSDIRDIQHWLASSPLTPEVQFNSKYQLAPWNPYVVEGRFKRRIGVLLALRRPGASAAGRIFLVCKRLPKSFWPGSVVFYYRGWLRTYP
jgi:hypothetical protein